MVALATALQEVISDEDLRDLPGERKYGVAFVFAGLPSVMDNTVNERVLAFLRRGPFATGRAASPCRTCATRIWLQLRTRGQQNRGTVPLPGQNRGTVP